MSDNREKSFRNLKRAVGVPVRLYLRDSLPLVPAFPLHPAFEYLSETHKSDYMRVYTMHVHGGGYSDVKNTKGTWEHAFRGMRDDNVWINGYRELSPYDVVYKPVAHMWRKLLGNGAYICRPRTPLTQDWFAEVNALLDERLEELRKHPATRPDDRREWGPYPIEWDELLGRIFHRVLARYAAHVLQTVPECVLSRYR